MYKVIHKCKDFILKYQNANGTFKEPGIRRCGIVNIKCEFIKFFRGSCDYKVL